MHYEIEFLPSALEQLRALPKDVRRLIGGKLDRAQHNLTGDIRKLRGFKNEYRLRAGNYRALFELEGACLVVYDVGNRKDIYE
jgi:mRNA interferase RelE/StbE